MTILPKLKLYLTFVISLGVALWTVVPSVPAIERGTPVHALAFRGLPRHGPDFNHLGYVNPDAPKGGSLKLMGIRTFDSFNPFIVKGDPATGLSYLGSAGFLFEGLMANGADEPNTSYCLICETVEVAEDNTWTEFVIRPEARFHDGSPITPEDVIFSFNTLTQKGLPLFRLYYGDVVSVEKTGNRSVRFIFKSGENFELPGILAQLSILSKNYWEGRDFEDSTLDPPIGSGPYRIDRFEPGRFVVFKRIEDYWAEDLPVKRGFHNFDEIRFEYYLDQEVAMEAFNAGEYDLRAENSASRWANAYRGDLIESGQVIRLELEDGTPDPAQWFVPNLRRLKFADRQVRKALALAFDFEWTNRTIAYGAYRQARSFFDGSDLASFGLPGPLELEILEPYRGRIPDEVFTQEFVPPQTDGSGNIRENLILANQLLTEAGWVEQDGKRVNPDTGEVLTIEFLVAQQNLAQWVNPFIRNLARLGIEGSVRVVDTAQFINRVSGYDFDMIITGWAQSLSPGNEQREFWGSAAADRTGSRNYAGIRNPVVDEIIEKLIVAQTREDLVAHTRALDRVLLWSHYTIPELSSYLDRIAYWNKFGVPDVVPLQGTVIDAWWFDETKTAALAAGTVAQPANGAVQSSEIANDSEMDAPDEPGNTVIIVSIAVIGVLLLLWSSLRRRNRR